MLSDENPYFCIVIKQEISGAICARFDCIYTGESVRQIDRIHPKITLFDTILGVHFTSFD